MKVAVLGYGVVGSGVAELLTERRACLEAYAETGLELKYIVDIRDFPESAHAGLFTKSFEDVLADPGARIIVETIGGSKAALEFTRRALAAGRHVVTSNKELVAEHGEELLALAEKQGVNYLFEASVGGGIPIIHPLRQCLSANEITEVCGILNGTTNFLLSRMRSGTATFDEALDEARRLGYAEADPSDDIDGIDAMRKICILASLAFGRHVRPSQASAEGIRNVTDEDVRFCRDAGYEVKLLGRALKTPDGRVCAYVAPHLVDDRSPLKMVKDVFNAIIVRGRPVGEVMFYGRGAGKLPTASAVAADILDAARHADTPRPRLWADGGEGFTAAAGELESRWYCRLPQGSLITAEPTRCPPENALFAMRLL